MPSPISNPSRPMYMPGPRGQRTEVRRAIPVESQAPARRGFFGRLFGPRDATSSTPATTGGGAPKPINQFAYPNAQLGNGSRTIAEAGCFLSSLTMASNDLHPGQNMGVLDANRTVKAAGGFSGSGLEMSQAAPALGMNMLSRRALGGVNDATVLSRLDQHLAAGNPAVMGVDFRPGSSSGHSAADHFITVYGRRGNDYLAMDPAGGVPVTLTRGSDGRLTYRGAADHKISEVLLLGAR